jgi:ribose transport system substrate-binding protein
MKLITSVVIAAATIAVISSAAVAQNIKLGIVVETLGNPYFACVKRAAEDEAKLHPEVDLTVLGAAVGTDLIGMTKMIDDLIQLKVDVLAFNAIDPNAMVQTAKRVEAAGIPVLIHSDDLSEKVARHFVGPDQYFGQFSVAIAVAEQLGGKGKIALMEGVPGNMSSILRKNGAKDALAKYSGIKLVGTWAANWDRAQGLKKAEDILTAHPDLSAIIAVNDDMALGALQAVKARGKLGEIIVTGFNGVEEAMQEVYRGNMLATVLTYCDSVGKQLVRTGIDVAKGQDDKSKYTIDTGTIPLDTKLLKAIGGHLKAAVK